MTQANTEPDGKHRKQRNAPVRAFEPADDRAQFRTADRLASFVTSNESMPHAEALIYAKDHEHKREQKFE
jgi:hypothetical protein